MFNEVSVNSKVGFGSDNNKKSVFGNLCSKNYEARDCKYNSEM